MLTKTGLIKKKDQQQIILTSSFFKMKHKVYKHRRKTSHKTSKVEYANKVQ